MLDATPVPFPRADPVPRRRRAPWILGVGVLVVLLAVGAYLLFRSGPNPATDLVGGLPKGLSLVVGGSTRSLFEHSLLKRELEKPAVQQALAEAKAASGIDVMGLETFAFGFQIADGQLQLLGVVSGTFDKDKLNGLFATIPAIEQTSQDGVALYLLRFGLPLESYLPEALLEMAPPDPPPLPVVADIAFGLTDSRHLVIGTPALIERYLAGGETVRDDAQLAPYLGRVDGEAFLWGVGRFAADGPEYAFFRDLAAYVPKPSGAADPPEWGDFVGSFQLRLVDRELIGKGVYDYLSEAEAAKGKTAMDASMRDVVSQLAGSGLKVDVAQSGSQVTLTMVFPAPFPRRPGATLLLMRQ